MQAEILFVFLYKKIEASQPDGALVTERSRSAFAPTRPKKTKSNLLNYFTAITEISTFTSKGNLDT
jgi:hypothetical protein